MTEQKKQSLYEYIRAAKREDGSLPPDFELPKEREENGLIFADGAMDGIMAFHSAGPGDIDISGLTEALFQAAEAETEAERAAVMEKIEDYFQLQHALSVIDSIQGWIVEHRETLPPGPIFELGLALASESADAESVKFGLSLLELFDTENNELQELVATLALSDEFTLFALFIASGWENGNDWVWRFAKSVNGWGKIHAVQRLEPATEEIRKWILCSGCQNAVMDNYLAVICAEKCGLWDRVRAAKLSDEEFRGAGVIIDALLQIGGPCADIRALEDGDQLLHMFLQHAAQRKADMELLTRLLNIRSYYEDLEREEKEEKDEDEKERPEKQKQAGLCAMELCRSLIDGADAESIIAREMEEGDLSVAVTAADRLGVDVRQTAWKRLEEAPLDQIYTAWYLMKDEEGAKRMAALYEETLPLADMASGVENLLGVGKEYQQYNCLGYLLQLLQPYPLTGERLVAAALNAPVVNNRSMASRVLVEWQKALGRPLQEFAPELYAIVRKNRELEIAGEHRERMDQLIDGRL